MTKYISKSALLAEIERLVNNYDKALDYEAALEDVRNFIDSLEVKEVDLEKELSTYLEVVKATDEDIDFVDFAKHFFELGIKAQKGE